MKLNLFQFTHEIVKCNQTKIQVKVSVMLRFIKSGTVSPEAAIIMTRNLAEMYINCGD